ncbi:MAG: indolepyruvate ferredoxin oxidoreductase subunit alpha [Deltaproteobacteria bacterium]|nr:indolepyruvate ferredoxin oxidoreductase subunit alpha [Deltaproteobacteria bacterium]MBW2015639.1 indolepyruvate ferredoxin oxidoreductase subunit alpha [Deltaproteobacteria bacterium]MBW2129784.1 indolepyruvate ferredoxin oxidoreductase subunit alpha [Deltaproteobacteria bacterium]MBW2302500.1 indolepyruvate ferredoxin oxidoreductase subunit alpha [Deltaproteobacteria bacterium]
MNREIFLGNGAIALGLVESGCQIVTSYPGTPSSEILPEVVRLVKKFDLNTYVEWSTNEKVALDNAFAASIAGKRAACCMKQVGLNVAADSLMSAAYQGTVGGLLIISCDDPGPHSSQTEQDTRFMARFAKVPVLDPSNPQEAREMVGLGLALSEEYRVPVILRPAIRVCHARQDITYGVLENNDRKANFEKDPSRWAATPKFRLRLHAELNGKLAEIGKRFETLSEVNFHTLEEGRHYPLGIITGGVPYAVVRDLLDEEGRPDIPVLKLGAPYPFPEGLVTPFLEACDRVIVIEETDTLIEYLIGNREKVWGRLSGHVPLEGELVPQVVHGVLNRALEESGLPLLQAGGDPEPLKLVENLDLPGRRPTLCPGCPHRASFFAIRKTRPKAIFTSDIGCYTLGLNLGAVDTCLDMGAAITMASGFYQAFNQDKVDQPIVATIGDSTFFHSGTAGLLNAVYNGARFILVILDNLTTAMTGMQPTPALGIRADGSEGKTIPLERVVAGCGVDFIQVVDPYDLEHTTETLKKAADYIREPEGGIAVIIARHPCLIAYRGEAIPEPKKVAITEDCVECNLCIERFECPAIFHDEELGRASINYQLCSGCGVCLDVCPKGAIVEVKEQ